MAPTWIELKMDTISLAMGHVLGRERRSIYPMVA
jgi:hypothetical protein